MIKISNDGKPERYTGEAISDKAKAFLFSESVPDAVNHPAHYNNGEYECIDVMIRQYGSEAGKHFCLLNAFKYIWRCEEKHDAPKDDVKKAIWYLEKYLELSSYDD